MYESCGSTWTEAPGRPDHEDPTLPRRRRAGELGRGHQRAPTDSIASESQSRRIYFSASEGMLQSW